MGRRRSESFLGVAWRSRNILRDKNIWDKVKDGRNDKSGNDEKMFVRGEGTGSGVLRNFFRHSSVCVDSSLIPVLLAACVQPC